MIYLFFLLIRLIIYLYNFIEMELFYFYIGYMFVFDDLKLVY